jgi:hypothetical protein
VEHRQQSSDRQSVAFLQRFGLDRLFGSRSANSTGSHEDLDTRSWPFERPPEALGFGYWLGVNKYAASVLMRDDGSLGASFDLEFWGRDGGDLDGSQPLWYQRGSRLGIACAAGWLLWDLETEQEVGSRSWYPAELQVDGVLSTKTH